MKKKIILMLVTLASLQSNRVLAVDNPVGPVDNPAAATPTGIGSQVNLSTATTIYHCNSDENENEFVLAELQSNASVTSFKGEDLYEGGDLKDLTKNYGFMSTQTTYSLANGGQLVISEHAYFGRGGTRGGGRGGDLDLQSQKIISAKLVSNEKEYYFSCY